MAIVTISRQLGSSGSEIAEALAKRMKIQPIDRDSLEELLVDQGIAEGKIDHFDEKRPNFWDTFSSDKDRYLHFLKSAILDVAGKGKAVILGRGAQILLKEVPGIAHIRCVAPKETRTSRIMEQFSCDEHNAHKLIQQSDHDRAGFYRFFFDIHWDDPDIYDVTINTSVFPVDAATDLITDTLKLKQAQTTPAETARRIGDLSLAQKVVTTILYSENIPVRFLGVFAENGEVTLAGSVNTTELVHRAEAVAVRTEGVESVKNDIQVLPEYTGTIM